jgi:hypothetical protein
MSKNLHASNAPSTDTALEQGLSEQDRACINVNLHTLAAFAWHSYRQCGRGAVVVDTTRIAADVQDDGRLVITSRLGYVTETQAQQQGKRLPPAMLRMIQSYTPERHIVVTFLRQVDGRDYMAHHCIATHPSPAEIFEQVGGMLFAQLN